MATKKITDTCGFGENTVKLFMGFTPKGYAAHRQMFIEACKEVLPQVMAGAGYSSMNMSSILSGMETSATMTLSMIEKALALVDSKLQPAPADEPTGEPNDEPKPLDESSAESEVVEGDKETVIED